jgi:hypothetical protein
MQTRHCVSCGPLSTFIGGVSCSMCRHCGATACEHSRRGLIALLLAFWSLAQMSSAANSASSSSLARAATGSRNALHNVHSGRVKLQLKNSRAASSTAASQRVQSLALSKGPHKAAPTTTTSKSNLYTLLSGGLAGSISR